MEILAEAVVRVADRMVRRNELAQETLDGGGRLDTALLEDLSTAGGRRIGEREEAARKWGDAPRR